jgi:hypothetical protein
MGGIVRMRGGSTRTRGSAGLGTMIDSPIQPDLATKYNNDTDINLKFIKCGGGVVGGGRNGRYGESGCACAINGSL